MNWRIWTVLLLVFGVVTVSAAGAEETIPDEARRHAIRGREAIEMAASPDDYRLAIEEFSEAVRLAPRWAEAHYNLAIVQEKAGEIAKAVESYQRYLDLNPTAPDAPRVRDEIVRLQYRLERRRAFLDLAGSWSNFGMRYEVRTEGERIVIHPPVLEPTHVEVVFQGLGGLAPVAQFAKGKVVDRFDLQVTGRELKGTFVRQGFVEQKSGCTIPEDRAEVTGTLSADGRRMELHYSYRFYRASYAGVFWGLESCQSVEPLDSRPVTLVLERK